MFKHRLLLLLLIPILGGISADAQNFAINNNLLFDLNGSLSAGVEIPLSRSTSTELYGSIRPWKRGDVSVQKHWTVQGQYRIWPCQLMNGFFYGPYIHGAQFNIGDEDLPFGLLRGLRNSRYEGWLVGGGMGIGYEYALARHWNLGAEIGAGYTYIDYKKSECQICGDIIENDNYHYVGISRIGLSIIYVF